MLGRFAEQEKNKNTWILITNENRSTPTSRLANKSFRRKLIDDEISINHGIKFHYLSETLAYELTVVDVVLGIGVNQVVVKSDLVLLEVRNCSMIDLKGNCSNVHVIAFHFSLYPLDLSCQISNRVNYWVLRLEEGLHCFLSALKLLKFLLLCRPFLYYLEPFPFKLWFPINSFKHGTNVKSFPFEP